MLKLLLGHWQAHRKRPPIILTDDPLYCTHLSEGTNHINEVYTVSRINPLYKDTDSGQTELTKPNDKVINESESGISLEEGPAASSKLFSESSKPVLEKTELLELNEDAAKNSAHMNKNSQFPQESVLVSVDVHRVSTADDIIIPSNTNTINTRTEVDTLGRDKSEETVLENINIDNADNSSETEVKVLITETIEPVVTLANPPETGSILKNPTEMSRTVSTGVATSTEAMNENTRKDMLSSLMRALKSKVPNEMEEHQEQDGQQNVISEPEEDSGITRTDSTTSPKDVEEISQSQSPVNSTSSNSKEVSPSNSEVPPVTEIGEFVTRKVQSNGKNNVEDNNHAKEINSSVPNGQKHSNLKELHRQMSRNYRCNVCKEHARSAMLHQFLPGHWGYDNYYLPGVHGMYPHHYLHPHQAPPIHHHSSTENLYPPFTNGEDFDHMCCHGCGKVRHSWSPYDEHSFYYHHNQYKAPSKTSSSSTNPDVPSDGRRPPDGSSQDAGDEREKLADGDIKDNFKMKSERKSFRSKICDCPLCEYSRRNLNENGFHCTCNGQALNYLQRRKVKFAANSKHSDVSLIDGDLKLPSNGNGHLGPMLLNPSKFNNGEEHFKLDGNGDVSPTLQYQNRGKKEPIKVDSLYRPYPLDLQEWEAMVRRKMVRRRRKRALNMIGMAIGIIIVVGIAITVTFMVIRRQR